MTKVKVTHMLARIFLSEVQSYLSGKEEDYVGIKIAVKFLQQFSSMQHKADK